MALLMGADSFLALSTWHAWDALPGLAHLVIADRGESALSTMPAPLAQSMRGRWVDDPAALRAAPAGRVMALHQPLQAESATEVRQRIATGGNWQALLPPPVAAFIQAHGLYGASAL